MLAGAPAWVMAVDRYAEVCVRPADQLTISATGFSAVPVSTRDLHWTDSAVAALCETILKHWGYDGFPQHLSISQTSDAFYLDTAKLGIGSSAAVCVALYRALASYLQRETSLAEALAIHRTFQGGSGSGLDVAASWLGGTLRFQQGAARAVVWPEHLAFTAVFTGQSANTRTHTRRFADWQQAGDTSALTRLCECAYALDEVFTEANLSSYINALKGLDHTAELDIYTTAHTRLSEMAAARGLLYKPCGAGGGDIGMAFAFGQPQQPALRDFANAAAAEFTVLDLKIAQILHTK